jgi:hypothetical protein
MKKFREDRTNDVRQDHFESTMHDADSTGDWTYQYVLRDSHVQCVEFASSLSPSGRNMVG